MSRNNKKIIMILLIMAEICLWTSLAIKAITNTFDNYDFILIAICFISISIICKLIKGKRK